jgi:hypothetical protein
MSGAIPDILLGSNDLCVLTDILHPYSIYVQQMFSSPEDGRMKADDLHRLRTRFLRMLHSADQQPILLTSREFETINQAFDLFLRAVPQVIPSSEERDATLQACRRMQDYFKKQVSHQRKMNV